MARFFYFTIIVLSGTLNISILGNSFDNFTFKKLTLFLKKINVSINLTGFKNL